MSLNVLSTLSITFSSQNQVFKLKISYRAGMATSIRPQTNLSTEFPCGTHTFRIKIIQHGYRGAFSIFCFFQKWFFFELFSARILSTISRNSEKVISRQIKIINRKKDEIAFRLFSTCDIFPEGGGHGKICHGNYGNSSSKNQMANISSL